MVKVVDGSGKTTVLGSFPALYGLAWSARGAEVWVAAGDSPSSRVLRALTLAGKERVVSRIAGTMTLLDASRDGRVAGREVGARQPRSSFRGPDTPRS